MMPLSAPTRSSTESTLATLRPASASVADETTE